MMLWGTTFRIFLYIFSVFLLNFFFVVLKYKTACLRVCFVVVAVSFLDVIFWIHIQSALLGWLAGWLAGWLFGSMAVVVVVCFCF